MVSQCVLLNLSGFFGNAVASVVTRYIGRANATSSKMCDASSSVWKKNGIWIIFERKLKVSHLQLNAMCYKKMIHKYIFCLFRNVLCSDNRLRKIYQIVMIWWLNVVYVILWGYKLILIKILKWFFVPEVHPMKKRF